MGQQLKLCGNHSEEDVIVSLQSEAKYIGFVFAKSKRQVTNEQVKQWLKKAGDLRRKQLVALFVNASIDEIKHSISGIPFQIIQCHGNESREDVMIIKKETGLSVWKVIHHHEQAMEKMKEYDGIADGYIIDCKVGDQWGGTGVSFDWRFVPLYLEEGKRQNAQVFIAGGINPSNIVQLLEYEPDGIDISSGIEDNGRKSLTKIKQLEERMKDYDKLS